MGVAEADAKIRAGGSVWVAKDACELKGSTKTMITAVVVCGTVTPQPGMLAWHSGRGADDVILATWK